MNKKRKIKEELKIKYQQANTFKITSIYLIILFLGLMSASITHAQTENYIYAGSFGFGEGSGDGQLNHPVGVAVDSSYNVYVTDNWNNRIEKFDSDYQYLIKWGSSGSANGQFGSLQGVVVDLQGNVYSVEGDWNDRVQKFDSNGNFITSWGSPGNGNRQFRNPWGITIDSAGNVYVADQSNNRIEKFDNNGKYLTQWGTPGNGAGQFNNPLGIAVDSSGNVYVADSGNNRIEKFSSNGVYITQWNSWGKQVDTLNKPCGVAVDLSGNVFVADLGSNRIVTFDSNGKYLTQWGSPGRGNGQFYTPEGVAVDSLGNVYVADSGNSRVQKFAPTIPNPIASFSSNVTSGYAPLSVKFTDTSTGTPTSWKWSFGDGKTSTLKNPAHTYSKAGKYTVSLTVKNAVGSNTTTKSSYISVTTVPVAAFTAPPTSGKVPLSVKFADKSTGSPTSWKWTFGDGTSSTVQNPAHKYTKAGKYTVSLTVKNAAGSNTKTISNYVTVKSK